MIQKNQIKRSLLLLSIVVIVALVAFGAFALYQKRYDINRSLERATLPEEVSYHQATATTPSANTAPSSKPSIPTPKTATPLPAAAKPPTASVAPADSLPAEINLAIPFTSQAPTGNWDAPYKEFCEEASVLMVMRYFANKPIVNSSDADSAMHTIQAFELSEFGYYEDTTAAETATIIQKQFGFKDVQLKTNPTVDDIKRALAAGKPVIVPAAGRQLGNPFYTPPGPLYHMLVIKGYTKNGQFITHDPGTRRGADYLYNENVIMNAIHDWHGDTNIEAGRSVVLIVG